MFMKNALRIGLFVVLSYPVGLLATTDELPQQCLISEGKLLEKVVDCKGYLRGLEKLRDNSTTWKEASGYNRLIYKCVSGENGFSGVATPVDIDFYGRVVAGLTSTTILYSGGHHKDPFVNAFLGGINIEKRFTVFKETGKGVPKSHIDALNQMVEASFIQIALSHSDHLPDLPIVQKLKVAVTQLQSPLTEAIKDVVKKWTGEVQKDLQRLSKFGRIVVGSFIPSITIQKGGCVYYPRLREKVAQSFQKMPLASHDKEVFFEDETGVSWFKKSSEKSASWVGLWTITKAIYQKPDEDERIWHVLVQPRLTFWFGSIEFSPDEGLCLYVPTKSDVGKITVTYDRGKNSYQVQPNGATGVCVLESGNKWKSISPNAYGITSFSPELCAMNLYDLLSGLTDRSGKTFKDSALYLDWSERFLKK